MVFFDDCEQVNLSDCFFKDASIDSDYSCFNRCLEFRCALKLYKNQV